MKEKKRKHTTASGKPSAEHENMQSVGARGSLLLQDLILHECCVQGHLVNRTGFTAC